MATAVGIDEAGDAHRLDPATIGGTDEVMLAATTVAAPCARARRGRPACAPRSPAGVAGDRGLVAVELRSETHDAIAWFDGARDPLAVGHPRPLRRDPVMPVRLDRVRMLIGTYLAVWALAGRPHREVSPGRGRAQPGQPDGITGSPRSGRG